MRITGGKFKGREIFSYKDKEGELRPTSSRTREAVYNLIRHGKWLPQIDFLTEDHPSLLDGATVADLYCGTGIMGFEALSRGAAKVIFVDKNDTTINMVKKSADKLNMRENCTFFKSSATMLPAIRHDVDIIFLDPPYETNLLKPTLESIAKNRWPRQSGIVICEHSIKDKLEIFPPFELLDEREYNNSKISILKVNYPK